MPRNIQTIDLVFFFCLCICLVHSFTKVLVPSVYNEWETQGPPSWYTDKTIQQRHNFTIFLYQKMDPMKSNFIPINRGTEGGVYLRYIVDHYDNFPDVAIFVHAKPEDHQPHWVDMIGCISPNATYISINTLRLVRSTEHW
jgi:hypothetical protein